VANFLLKIMSIGNNSTTLVVANNGGKGLSRMGGMEAFKLSKTWDQNKGHGDHKM
jgi:hypothetical protein